MRRIERGRSLGSKMSCIRVDGWKQAYLMPDGLCVMENRWSIAKFIGELCRFVQWLVCSRGCYKKRGWGILREEAKVWG
jgi:hypothetical protein